MVRCGEIKIGDAHRPPPFSEAARCAEPRHLTADVTSAVAFPALTGSKVDRAERRPFLQGAGGDRPTSLFGHDSSPSRGERRREIRNSHHAASFSKAAMPIIGSPPDFCKDEDMDAFRFELLEPNRKPVAVPIQYLHERMGAVEKDERMTDRADRRRVRYERCRSDR